jgi:hexosaminidase
MNILTNIALVVSLALLAPLAAEPLAVVPRPVSLIEGPGSPFTLTAQTHITYNSKEAASAAELLAFSLRPATGLPLPVKAAQGAQPGNIHLQLGSEIAKTSGREAYQIIATDKSVALTGRRVAGLISATQTLRQLLDPEIYRVEKSNVDTWTVPVVTIADEPAYPWRGMMLDVSRYFFTKEYVMRYLDMMALHRLNVFHWHLIDDSGWRIEIKKYPRLTEIGAWRGPGGQRYGGFYTQDDIREIVAYAKARNIEVVPEIAIPAHTLSALVAYPELGCTGQQFEVPTTHSISPEIYCVGRETTWTFLENVMDEVCALFPAKFIHIGGDEARYDRWNTCNQCQARMKKEGLKSAHHLQGWATTRIENILKKHGKKIIGWDEILDCGVSNQAGIMTWHKPNTAADGARRGNPVVLSLTTHAYFDTAESKLPGEPPTATWLPTISLEKAYSWEPTPAGLDEESARNILGASGSVWTDQFLHSADALADKPGQGTAKSEAYLDYLSLPRMAALAEVAWTPQPKRNYEDFSRRMKTHYLRYQNAGYQFRMPTPSVEVKPLANGTLQVTGTSPITSGSVRYTLDGSEPTSDSKELDSPLTTPKDAIFKAATYAIGGSHSLTWTHVDASTKFADLGREIGQWKSGQVGNAKAKEIIFDATGFIDSNGTYLVTFQFTGGEQRLDIDGITVVRNDSDPVAEDIHHGFTGGSANHNTYTINVKNYQTGASFKIKAMIYGDTGDDSNGVVLIRKK